MKLLILFSLCSLFIFSTFGQVNPNYHYVNGYTRQDGTYVQGYYRTNPNSTNTDNYSTKPNVNPWTDKPGTIEPDNFTNSNYSSPTYSNTYPSYYSTSGSVNTNYYYSNSKSTAEIQYHNRYSYSERLAIEQLLYDFGLYPGYIDGVFTQTTITAIEILQSIIGVEADGKFGDITLNKLIEMSNQ